MKECQEFGSFEPNMYWVPWISINSSDLEFSSVLCQWWCMASSWRSLWNNIMSKRFWRSSSIFITVHKYSQFSYGIVLYPFFISELNNGAVKLAVVSNFDSRLRKLLKDLNVLDLWVSHFLLWVPLICNVFCWYLIGEAVVLKVRESWIVETLLLVETTYICLWCLTFVIDMTNYLVNLIPF